MSRRCKGKCAGCDGNKSLAARLNKRITILREPGPDDVDEYNEPLDDWQPLATIWGAIEPLRGQEFFAAQQFNAEVTTRIRVRFRQDIKRTMRVRYRDAIFEILYVIHPEFAEKELQLMCRERQ